MTNNSITKTFYNRHHFDLELYIMLNLYKNNIVLTPDIINIKENINEEPCPLTRSALRVTYKENYSAVITYDTTFHILFSVYSHINDYIIESLIDFAKIIERYNINYRSRKIIDIIKNIVDSNCLYINTITLKFYIIDLQLNELLGNNTRLKNNMFSNLVTKYNNSSAKNKKQMDAITKYYNRYELSFIPDTSN